MPNWCYTNIYINDEDSMKLKKLYDLIEKYTSKEYVKSDFKNNWLGNIVIGAKIGTVDKGKETDLRCRGSINHIMLYENQLEIETETAWIPMVKMFKKLVDKYSTGSEIIYTSEECGCGIYWTNDPCIAGKYYIDPFDYEDMEIEYEAKEEYVISILQKELNTKENNIDILMHKFENSDLINKIIIHKWEYVDIEELE